MSQQINLLNPALLTSKAWLDIRMMAILMGVTALLMILAYGWNSYRVTQLMHEQQVVTQALANLKQQLELSIQKNVPLLPSKVLQQNIVKAKVALKENQQVQTFLKAGYFGNAQGYSGYMTAFARQDIKGLWLTHFSIDDTVITIRGRALSQHLIPKFIAGLGHEPVLIGRNFSSLEMHAVALATKVTPVRGNMPASTIPHRIIEFKLQSQAKKIVTKENKSEL